MKNFRKVLALVLVVATLFSFTAMASAKTYTDADKVSYKQAVDVLSAVGVLEGYEDDSFKPTNTISREEMAKMIAVLANAGDDVSKLYASACTFADVAKDRWSASYVAYCAKTGIVAGRSTTTFDPTGKVTGLETAKMLLVVLGFSAEEQGYLGADWKVNVLRDAKNMGLLVNFDAKYDIEKAITREEAAQMMMNALMTKVVVGVLSNNVIKVTNAVYNYLNGTLLDANKDGKIVNLYGNVLVSNTILWEALYGGKLSTTAFSRDCFGRPSVEWVWTDAKGNAKTIGKYPVTPVWTSYDTSVNGINGQIAAFDAASTTGSVNYFVDGVAAANLTGVKIGHGVQVELYAWDRNVGTATAPVIKTQLEVVVINTYLGYVGHPNTAKGTVAITSDGATVVGSVANTYGFKPADEGTPVLYWVCSKNETAAGQQIHAVEVTEPTVITLHGNRNYAEYFCDSNEKVYKYNAATTARVTDNLLGKDLYIYTDKYGFVLAFDVVGVKTTVSVLVGGSGRETLKSTDNYGKDYKDWTAKFVEFEANAAVSDATAVTQNMFSTDSTANTTAKKYDVLVKWTQTAGGERDIAVKAQSTQATVQGEEYVLNKGKGVITNFALAGDDNTQYLLRLFDADTGKYVYKYFDGCKAIDGTYKLNELQYFTAYDGTDYENRYVSYVYADATYAYAPSLAFVLSYATDEAYWTGATKVDYYLYNAVVNGEEAYVAFTKESVGNGLNGDGIANALSNAINNAANPYVFRAVKSEYVKVIADTHDDKPIYLANSIEGTKGTDFLVSGNVLTFVGGAPVQIADGATIVVAADYLPTNPLYTDEVVVLKDSADLVNYLKTHGWTTAYGWYDDSTGEVTDLYLYVTED